MGTLTRGSHDVCSLPIGCQYSLSQYSVLSTSSRVRDSPPVAKKLQKVGESGVMSATTTTTLGRMPTSRTLEDRQLYRHYVDEQCDESTDGGTDGGAVTPVVVFSKQRDGSILKCSKSSPALSDVTRGRAVSCDGGCRHVNFQPRVLVFHFDRQDGDHVSSESQQLNQEPRTNRAAFLARTLSKLNSSAVSNTAVSRTASPSATRRPLSPKFITIDNSTTAMNPIGGQSMDCADNFTSKVEQTQHKLSTSQTSAVQHNRPLPCLNTIGAPFGRTTSTSQCDLGTDINFTFFEDQQQRLKLKFSVALGPGVAASDVLVKANMTGNKIRVVAVRTATSPQDGCTLVRQDFSERYVLPMDVDPYAVTARLDTHGNLYVEAPVKTWQRRDDSTDRHLSDPQAKTIDRQQTDRQIMTTDRQQSEWQMRTTGRQSGGLLAKTGDLKHC